LRGRRIVVTRAREQAGELVRALEEMGAEVVLAPTIRIEPLPDLEPLRRALSRLADYRWTVFTSQNTVHVVRERVAGWGLSPHIFAQTRVAAIGPATADALGAAGVRVELVPAGYVAESLVEALATQDSLGGARILIPAPRLPGTRCQRDCRRWEPRWTSSRCTGPSPPSATPPRCGRRSSQDRWTS